MKISVLQDAEAVKAQFGIQVQRRRVGCQHRVELQVPEPQRFGLGEGIPHQRLSDMGSPSVGSDRIAGVGVLAQMPDAVGVEDVQADDLALVLRHGGEALAVEERVRFPWSIGSLWGKASSALTTSFQMVVIAGTSAPVNGRMVMRALLSSGRTTRRRNGSSLP